MNNFNRWEKHRFTYGVCNVNMMYDHYFKYLLGKCHQLFQWTGLPETIDEAYLNNTLFIDGDICFTEFNGDLYALEGHQGGEIDCYHYGKHYTIANPVLGSKDVVIGSDGVVMYNSDVDKARFLGGGLYSLISSTATLLADNLVSINCAQINTRVQTIVTASDDGIARAAEIVLKDKYNGKPYAVVTDDITDNTIKVNATPDSTGTITELVELQQSIMANFYNAIGIKMNSIRKKQRMITDEINAQDNYIAVSIDEMLKSRLAAVDKINAMFGTNITVCINPILDDFIDEKSETTDENSEKSENDMPEILDKDSNTNVESDTTNVETMESDNASGSAEIVETAETEETKTENSPAEEVSTEEKILDLMQDQLEIMSEIISEGDEEENEQEQEETVFDSTTA